MPVTAAFAQINYTRAFKVIAGLPPDTEDRLIDRLAKIGGMTFEIDATEVRCLREERRSPEYGSKRTLSNGWPRIGSFG